MQSQPSRRRFLAMLAAGASAPILAACSGGPAEAKSYPVQFTEAEWRRKLTPAQFYILRQKGTERPGSSALLGEHRRGTFACAADGNPLYASSTKFESHTGWPSFWQPRQGAVETSTDFETGYPRTEVHCKRCGGHLGHVFDDGPPPTGKRYCMNGDAMVFQPA